MTPGVVLGLDTATRATVVGVVAGDTALEAWDDPPTGARPAHATALMPLAARLLRQAGVGWTDVGRIAVGLGPGSFTGLRIGVATARGLAQSAGAELTGVSTLRALAAPAMEAAPGRRVLALVEGGRGEVFAGGWNGDAVAIPAQPVPRGDLAALVRGTGGDWVAVGEPADALRDALAAAGVDVPPENSPLHRISGLALCRVEPAVAGRDNVVPDYLRLPDAEISRRARDGSIEK
jgi:tRNA threonylcarbamoyladenosine biosynthesis protein TsaB